MTLTIKKRLAKRILIIAAATLISVFIFSLPVVAENLYAVYENLAGYTYAAEFENAKDMNIKVSDPNLNIDSVKVGGDIYYLCGSKANGNSSCRDTLISLSYSKNHYYTSYSNDKTVYVIDINNIDEVFINGVKVYQNH